MVLECEMLDDGDGMVVVDWNGIIRMAAWRGAGPDCDAASARAASQ